MKKIILIESMLTCFLASAAFSKDVKPESSWFLCKTDDDCVEINYTCIGGVVNKNYSKIANDYYQMENARTNCVGGEPTEAQKKIPYKVFCEAKKCKAQGVNPKKPGFS